MHGPVDGATERMIPPQSFALSQSLAIGAAAANAEVGRDRGADRIVRVNAVSDPERHPYYPRFRFGCTAPIIPKP